MFKRQSSKSLLRQGSGSEGLASMKGMEVNCDTNPNSMTSTTSSSMGSPNDGTPGCALKRSSFQSPRSEYAAAAKQLIVGKGVVLKAEVAEADLVVIEV
jgi:hypothetical protein